MMGSGVNTRKKISNDTRLIILYSWAVGIEGGGIIPDEAG